MKIAEPRPTMSRGVRLLEAEERVAENVPDDHQHCEIPQREQPQLRIFVRVKKNRGVERGSFHGAIPPFLATI